jgi:hypothetical protein
MLVCNTKAGSGLVPDFRSTVRGCCAAMTAMIFDEYMPEIVEYLVYYCGENGVL